MEDGTADTGALVNARRARVRAASAARCGGRVLALLMCVAAIFAISSAPSAAAATPDAPRGFMAQSTSMGLSVALSWSAVDGAVRYRIYRLSSPFTDVAAADLLAETDGTSYRARPIKPGKRRGRFQISGWARRALVSRAT